MKPQVILTAGLTAMVMADQWPMAKQRCGRLGAMEWDPNDLPAGVDPIEIRMCADHPNGVGNYWGLGKYLPDWVPRNPLADIHWPRW
ncbi:GPI anchored glyco [Fusarium beomiforme]|uniref:GPI anchored glyco n=1 Tax=Fusarium beomiforme TaxID=44412 RepID=A0A9P5AMM4_9HYPO|nr:GPI anchored glyco [Fusarium beomiforme]